MSALAGIRADFGWSAMCRGIGGGVGHADRRIAGGHDRLAAIKKAGGLATRRLLDWKKYQQLLTP
jgi:hypothetical protein